MMKIFIIHYCNSYCKRNGIQLSAPLLYLKNVLYWPEDDRLQSKHVAAIIIFIYCNWVVTRWQWLIYMYTKYETGY